MAGAVEQRGGRSTGGVLLEDEGQGLVLAVEGAAHGGEVGVVPDEGLGVGDEGQLFGTIWRGRGDHRALSGEGGEGGAGEQPEVAAVAVGVLQRALQDRVPGDHRVVFDLVAHALA